MADWKDDVRHTAEGMTQVPQITRGEIPDIDLYMDQLVTYLDRRLAFFRPDANSPLVTGAMINNYSKQKLLPSAKNKRYSARHIMSLSLICQLKRVLPVQDMDKIFAADGEEDSLAALYDLFLHTQQEAFSHAPALADQLIAAAGDLSEDEGTAAVVLQLAAEAQLRLLMAQRLLDSRPHTIAPEKKKKDKDS